MWCFITSQVHSMHYLISTLPWSARLLLPVLEMRKLRQGFCDLPGITQFNWTPNSEVPSSSGITPDGPHLLSSAPVLLNHRKICLPGDIWQYLEVFWLSQLEEGSRVEVLLASRGWRPRMLLNILHSTGQAPQQRTVWPKIFMMPSFRNSALGTWKCLKPLP